MRTSTPFRFRIARFLTVGVAAGLVLVGCASPGGGKPSSDGSLEGKKVTYIACGDQNQWCKAANHRMIDALEDAGVEVTYLQDPYDPVLQVQNLNQAIAQKPDLIVIIPTDALSVVPALRQAQAAGIPVINFVGPTVPESADYFEASIEVDVHELGRNAARVLVEGLQEEGVTSGNIIAITGTTSGPEVPARMEGFNEILSEYPEYELVEVQDGGWDQVKTSQIAQQLFAKYQDKGGIVGAYGMADHMAAGIIQAAQQADIPVGIDSDGVVVVASNCFKIGIENIEKGLQFGTSTQAANEVADFAVPLIEDFLKGQDIPKVSLTKEFPITKDNVADWKDACSVA